MTKTTDASSTDRNLTIRLSTPDDEPALIRLAQLDSARPLGAAPALVAEEDGELVAARSLESGVAIADPFRRSAATVALLEVRAAELVPASRPVAPRRALRRAFRPLYATRA